MTPTHVCQTCGSTRTTAANDGFCTACMLRSALIDTDPDTTVIMTSALKLPRPFGAYELETEIARGGMGVVYKARQSRLNRTVALKVLISGAYSSESLLRRFQTEAESAAALQHPGIVAIHEFGEWDNQPYYTMDYVEGRNLSEVAGGLPLDPTRAARYLHAIAEAVYFAHERGILHRDLKPSNVLIDRDDKPRVADFGLAKRLRGGSDATLAGQMLGSPNYASPEQAAGRQQDVGVTSDVYSLGAILYTLLTGRPVFLGNTVEETLRLVFNAEPVAPRDINRTVPRDLETISLKCLEKDPARRYASARVLAEELQRFLQGQPILARPVSPPEQLWRWGRRHPTFAALAATVVLALTATSVIFYTSARRIEHARAKEQIALREAQDDLYAANMLVASFGFTAAAGYDPKSLRHSLDRTRPKTDGRDVRGFEWRHFWYRGQSDALATLRGHDHMVTAALFSPDGNRVATHSHDRSLKFWEPTSGRETHSVPDVAQAGGFTPDGQEFVFSRPDQSLWQFDLRTRELKQVLAPTGQLIALHPDGRQAVIVGSNGRPELRSLGAPGPQEKGAPLPLEACSAMAADGRTAAVAGPHLEGAIVVVDLGTNREVAVLRDPRPVTGLALSPDGTCLVSASFDGVLKIWRVSDGKMERALKAFLDPVWALAFSADGQSFAAGGNNREVGIWSASSWSRTERLFGHESTLHSLAFSPDGQRLVSGAEDELAHIWPAKARRLPDEKLKLLRGPGPADRTPGIAFSPDSKRFAGTAADGTITIWRTDTMESVATFPSDVRSVAFSPDGESLLSEDFHGVVQRWSVQGAPQAHAPSASPSLVNWQVGPLTPKERVALVAEQRETRAQRRLCEIPSARDGINAGKMLSTHTIALTPDGQTMFVGLPDGMIQVWNVETRLPRFTFRAHKLGVTALAVSEDGRYLATGSMDNTTKLIDAATGDTLATFNAHNRPVWAVAFSPDGQTLAAGSCDKVIILCSVPLRRHVSNLPLYAGLPEGYEQEVRLMRFSPDGNILAAALGDGTLRFFRAAPFSQTDAEAAPDSARLALRP
ncbi:protein kinase domain-containing protein [Horticoccus sp. 23ND18S-11]|uniref:protein kinase domain-containing protein n=1 Tax=Horticoccus sp. 23ND18S-11 TaxID=3391832 RepID=UPI0039C9C190